MKNYLTLFHRGIKYNLTAAFNWNRRRTGLTKYIWQTLIHKSNHPSYLYKRERIENLIKVLDYRIKILIDHLETESEKQKEANRTMIESKISLQCSNPYCEFGYSPSHSLEIARNNYIPGWLRCQKCKHILITKQDADINVMLFEMNILLPAT